MTESSPIMCQQNNQIQLPKILADTQILQRNTPVLGLHGHGDIVQSLLTECNHQQSFS